MLASLAKMELDSAGGWAYREFHQFLRALSQTIGEGCWPSRCTREKCGQGIPIALSERCTNPQGACCVLETSTNLERKLADSGSFVSTMAPSCSPILA